jgi:uncharacterized tellurite resistance protein B-like protein
MKQHIETITQLLLGAAYADKRLAGAEVTRIRALLITLIGGGELPDTIHRLIAGFSPAAFSVHKAAAELAGLSTEEKRTLLELVASVNDADDELDLAESTYLRNLAVGLGVAEADFADLTLEILEEEELRGLLA